MLEHTRRPQGSRHHTCTASASTREQIREGSQDPRTNYGKIKSTSTPCVIPGGSFLIKTSAQPSSLATLPASIEGVYNLCTPTSTSHYWQPDLLDPRNGLIVLSVLNVLTACVCLPNSRSDLLKPDTAAGLIQSILALQFDTQVARSRCSACSGHYLEPRCLGCLAKRRLRRVCFCAAFLVLSLCHVTFSHPFCWHHRTPA